VGVAELTFLFKSRYIKERKQEKDKERKNEWMNERAIEWKKKKGKNERKKIEWKSLQYFPEAKNRTTATPLSLLFIYIVLVVKFAVIFDKPVY
jgi:hypothetical protein